MSASKPFKSLRGQLLIAPPAMRDPNFARGVVLMVQHGDEGGLGLLLNRPTAVPVKEAWKHVSESPCHVEETLGQGGPCQGPLMALHTCAQVGEVPVIETVSPAGGKLGEALIGQSETQPPRVFFSAQEDHLIWLMEHGARRGRVRFFIGYAGWSPDQLEAEIEAGGWHVTRPRAGHVFNEGDLWPHLSAEAALGRRLNPRIMPIDPRMN